MSTEEFCAGRHTASVEQRPALHSPGRLMAFSSQKRLVSEAKYPHKYLTRANACLRQIPMLY